MTPISPCHGVVSSTSQRDAAIDYGDVVLWDAVPVGVAEHEGKKVPRFPLLALLRRGDERRFRFVALQQGRRRRSRRSARTCPRARSCSSTWSASKCSARAARAASTCTSTATSRRRNIGWSTANSCCPRMWSSPRFASALEEQLRAHPRVQLVVPGLLEAIGDTAAAGKAHQLWRGLERVGLRSSQ